MKKWLIVAIVVVVIVGASAGFFFTRGESSNVATPDEEKPVTAGTIQVPGGPKIKVIFNGPPELETSWEKLGMAGFQLQLIGTLTNGSKQSLKFSEVAFLLDGQQVAFISGKTLAPAEQMKIQVGLVGYTENTKVLEVRIKDFQKIGSPTTPAPTTPQPTTPEPTTAPTPAPGQTIFTEAPKNPKNPGQVVAAFVFSMVEADYGKFKELASSKYLESFSKEKFEKEMNSEEGKAWRQNFKTVEITKETIEGDRAMVKGLFYFKKPTSSYPDATDPSVSFNLIKEDGRWRVVPK